MFILRVKMGVNQMRVIQLPSGGKFYETSYGLFPSVTTVLQATMPEDKRHRLANWRKTKGKEAEAIRQAAVDRGKAIHKLVEAQCNGHHLICPPEFEEFWTETRKFLGTLGKVVATEKIVYHPSLRYAGTLDLLAEWHGILTLIDIKTSYRPKRTQYLEEAKIQIAAYCYPCEELLRISIPQGMVIVVSPSNMQLFTMSKEDLERYWELWLKRVEQYKILSLYDQIFERQL
jgi:genome maintenance exonuclease 1